MQGTYFPSLAPFFLILSVKRTFFFFSTFRDISSSAAEPYPDGKDGEQFTCTNIDNMDELKTNKQTPWNDVVLPASRSGTGGSALHNVPDFNCKGGEQAGE